MKEHRRAERVIPVQQPKGTLVLYVEDQGFDVKSVRDVSPFGAGVCIESDINKGTKIRLNYQIEGDDLQVFGIVAWSSPVEVVTVIDEMNLYRIGICLQPENVEDNLNFYRLMTS